MSESSAAQCRAVAAAAGNESRMPCVVKRAALAPVTHSREPTSIAR